MANRVITNAFVSINAVNLSAFVKQVTLNWKAEQQDDTAMGDTARSRIPGLKDWDFDVEFFQDYAASAVDATLFSLVGAAPFAVEIRGDGAAVSATNPKYTGNATLESYQPVAGEVGQNQMAPTRFLGVGTLTRATA